MTKYTVVISAAAASDIAESVGCKHHSAFRDVCQLVSLNANAEGCLHPRFPVPPTLRWYRFAVPLLPPPPVRTFPA